MLKQVNTCYHCIGNSDFQNSWWQRKLMLIWFWFYEWFVLHQYTWAHRPVGVCVQRGKTSQKIFWDNVACGRADSERKQWWFPVFKENGIQDAALKQQISCHIYDNKDKLHAYAPQYTWNNVLYNNSVSPWTMLHDS